jgi:hypothetical protein
VKKSYAVVLYLLAVALAVGCAAIIVFWAPDAHACGNGHSAYVPRTPDKPVIPFDKLTADQKAQLKRFGAEFTAAVETISNGVDGNETDKKKWRQQVDAANELLRSRLIELGEKLSFRTTMTVGNGMLCGAQIEIQVPPVEQDIESGGLGSIWVKGKSRDGTASEGVFSDALRQISLIP